MNQNELYKLTDQELLEEEKKMRISPLIDATFIGFLIGIVIYSVVKNTWGLVTLVPLFLVYMLLKKSKRNEEIIKLLKDRNLK